MAYTPKIVDAWLTEPFEGYPGVIRYHSRGWAGIRAIVVHVQDGSSRGTQMHFRTVKASSTVLIDKDGTIRRLVQEDKAPWTNGDVDNPDAQVRDLMAKYGGDPNTWCLTIEAEGMGGSLPNSEAQYQSILWQIRDWRNRYGKVPVLAHRQINSVTRPGCPELPGGVLLPRLYNDLASDTAPSPAPAPAPSSKRTFTTRFELYLRTSPGFWDYEKGQNNIVRLLPAGTKGTIIEGPKEAEGISWYDISIPGIGTGWVQDEVLHTLSIATA